MHFYLTAFFRKLEKEKKLLNSLESKEKEKTKHLLNVQKAILKSKGEKVYVS